MHDQTFGSNNTISTYSKDNAVVEINWISSDSTLILVVWAEKSGIVIADVESNRSDFLHCSRRIRAGKKSGSM